MRIAPVLALAAATVSATGRRVLLVPGEFHGNEVMASTGERWLGLFTDGVPGWRPVTLLVSPFEDLDDDEGEKTGKKVEVSGGSKPLLMVSGMDGLAQSPVATSWSGSRELFNGEAVPLTLGDHSYVLEAANGRSAEKPIGAGSELRVRNGSQVQVLYDLRRGAVDGPNWLLLWAGDADGDGRLDLFVDVSAHYDVSEKILFLSSLAAPGALVDEAARMRTVGS